MLPVEPSPGLLRALLIDQFPHWQNLAIQPTRIQGTDNAVFRLGDTLCARLPKRDWACRQIETERVWLGRLQPLPVSIPKLLAVGQSTADYPSPWAIYEWIPGTSPRVEDGANTHLAFNVAGFIRALKEKQITNGPPQRPAQSRSRGSFVGA